MNRPERVVIIGGGPAGLTAAYALQKAGVPSAILEKDGQVGGHARTARHGGFRFDIGGHRFFTKIPEVERIWREVLGSRFLRVQRLSRIHYRGKFFHYPLRAWDALWKMGPLESAWVFASYLRKKVFPLPEEKTLEQWMINRFGPRLFFMFFKTYTEKVWGLRCSEIGAEWAAQRIKTLTLWGAIRNALFPGGNRPRSLIEEFDYPDEGPGLLWETMADRLREGGQEIHLRRTVTGLRHEGGRIVSVVTVDDEGNTAEHRGSDVIASMPLAELVQKLDPPASSEALAHARALEYRDFITVALMIRRPDVFPDNWIYVHTPSVRVARIQNYKNWSHAMVPDAGTTCLGLEYFCTVGDDLWSLSDEQLLALGRREIEAVGLARAAEVFDGAVIRQEKAYPVYRGAYQEHVEGLRRCLTGFSNLQMVGRNGLHKYNNQDHAMLTALLAVRNLLGESHDVWAVNTEQEYHEEAT